MVRREEKGRLESKSCVLREPMGPRHGKIGDSKISGDEKDGSGRESRTGRRCQDANQRHFLHSRPGLGLGCRILVNVGMTSTDGLVYCSQRTAHLRASPADATGSATSATVAHVKIATSLRYLEYYAVSRC